MKGHQHHIPRHQHYIKGLFEKANWSTYYEDTILLFKKRDTMVTLYYPSMYMTIDSGVPNKTYGKHGFVFNDITDIIAFTE